MKKKTKTSFEELIKSKKPVLIDFFAHWCGPCKSYTPILKNVKEDLKDRVRIVKLDVDKHQELSQSLQVRGIPTTMIFQDGELKFRGSGVLSKDILMQELEKLT